MKQTKQSRSRFIETEIKLMGVRGRGRHRGEGEKVKRNVVSNTTTSSRDR